MKCTQCRVATIAQPQKHTTQLRKTGYLSNKNVMLQSLSGLHYSNNRSFNRRKSLRQIIHHTNLYTLAFHAYKITQVQNEDQHSAWFSETFVELIENSNLHIRIRNSLH